MSRKRDVRDARFRDREPVAAKPSDEPRPRPAKAAAPPRSARSAEPVERDDDDAKPAAAEGPTPWYLSMNVVVPVVLTHARFPLVQDWVEFLATQTKTLSRDSWYLLAREASITADALFAANGASTATALYPGQSICLPDGAVVVTTTAPPVTAATPSSTVATVRTTVPATSHTTAASG